jgi:hypothetical protein
LKSTNPTANSRRDGERLWDGADADGGVRTGRLPVVDVGAPVSPVDDGGVRRGVVSDTGGRVDGVGSGTTGAAHKE